MKLSKESRIDILAQGDILITEPGEKFASYRIRHSDGAIRTPILNESLDDPELEAEIRQFIQEHKK